MRNATVQRPAAAKAALLATAIVTGIAAPASTAPLVVLLSGCCLALIIALLWRFDEPPILLLPPLFQWSEVAIWPLATVWRQVPLSSRFGADLDASAPYGLAGVAALAIGLWMGSWRSRSTQPFSLRLRAEAMQWRFRQVATVAAAAMIAGYLASAVSNFAGPARELFNQLSSVRYVGLFALAYWCLLHGRKLRVLAAVMAFEIIFGMTGFFAEFKNSILTFLVAAMSARTRVRPADVLVIGSAGALLMVVAIFWSAVKAEYRLLVNEGTGAQVVSIPLTERLSYLADAAGSMDGQRIGEGFDRLVDRHGYIEFLGLTMANVPSTLPHEDGQLTLAVLSHIAMPRFLFPGKPPLPSDTEVMAKYTGLPMTWNENTSISIGHLGELYIDFGYVGGLAAMALIGWLVGTVYRKLCDYKGASEMIAAGFCLMTALPIAYFGAAYIKLMGAFVFSSAIALVLQRFVEPRLLPTLMGRRAAARIRVSGLAFNQQTRS